VGNNLETGFCSGFCWAGLYFSVELSETCHEETVCYLSPKTVANKLFDSV
jgi:hypothetical protein